MGDIMKHLYLILCSTLILHASDISAPIDRDSDGEIVIPVTTSDWEVSLGSLPTPPHELCEQMIDYFFKGNGEHIRDRILPKLQRQLENVWHHKKVTRLQTLTVSERKLDPSIEKFIVKRVAYAMEEALDEERSERERFESEAKNRVTKTRAALLTAAATIISALITGGLSIGVTLSSCE